MAYEKEKNTGFPFEKMLKRQRLRLNIRRVSRLQRSLPVDAVIWQIKS